MHLADAAASRAIEINPRLAYAYHVRGLVLRVKQPYERAIAVFDMAVQLNPSLAPAHAEFGFAKQALAGNTGGLNHALDGLTVARSISPGDPVLANWLYGVGVGFLKLREDARAIRWLNELIGLNPLPQALAYLAAAYALSGDETQARRALSEFRRMRPRENSLGIQTTHLGRPSDPSGLAGVRGTAKGWIAGTVELASSCVRQSLQNGDCVYEVMFSCSAERRFLVL